MNNKWNGEYDVDGKPDISLGNMTFTLDLDTGQYTVNMSKSSTGQLTNPNEVTQLFSMTACALFAAELKRRSRRVIVSE